MSITINDKRFCLKPKSIGDIAFGTIFTGRINALDGLFCCSMGGCFEIGGYGRVFIFSEFKGIYPGVQNYQPVAITITIDYNIDIKEL